MPQIGQIDVPLGLWEKLIEVSTTLLTNLILQSAQRSFDVNLTEISEALNLESPTSYEYLESCVIALIRIQKNDYISSNNDIEYSNDYIDVWNAAADVAELICYQSLPTDSYLRTIAAQHLQHFMTNEQNHP